MPILLLFLLWEEAAAAADAGGGRELASRSLMMCWAATRQWYVVSLPLPFADAAAAASCLMMGNLKRAMKRVEASGVGGCKRPDKAETKRVNTDVWVCVCFGSVCVCLYTEEKLYRSISRVLSLSLSLSQKGEGEGSDAERGWQIISSRAVS